MFVITECWLTTEFVWVSLYFWHVVDPPPPARLWRIIWMAPKSATLEEEFPDVNWRKGRKIKMSTKKHANRKQGERVIPLSRHCQQREGHFPFGYIILFNSLFRQVDFYHELVETFCNVSECKTFVYFGWWFTLQFRWPGDLDRYSFLYACGPLVRLGAMSIQFMWPGDLDR